MAMVRFVWMVWATSARCGYFFCDCRLFCLDNGLQCKLSAIRHGKNTIPASARFRFAKVTGGDAKKVHTVTLVKLGEGKWCVTAASLGDAFSVARAKFRPVALGRDKNKEKEWKEEDEYFLKCLRECDATESYQSCKLVRVDFLASGGGKLRDLAFAVQSALLKIGDNVVCSVCFGCVRMAFVDRLVSVGV